MSDIKGLSHNELLVEAQNRLIENLQASEKKYQQLVDHLRDVVFRIDLNYNWIFLNPAWERVTGIALEDSLGSSLFLYLSQASQDRCRHIFTELLKSEVSSYQLEIWFTPPAKAPILMELFVQSFKDETGQFSGFTGTLTDITDRHKAEQELRLAAYAFDTIEAIVILNANADIIRVNQAFSQITGYASNEVIGQNIRILKSGQHDVTFYTEMWSSLLRDGRWQGEIYNRKKSGETFPEWLVATAVKNESGQLTHFVASFNDISERKAAERQIRHLAYHDPLTGLPNRRLLMEHLESSLPQARRHNFYSSLVYIDLDRFKEINDNYGHQVGDRVLQEVANRLSEGRRSEDIVSRMGGDEFVIYLSDIGSTRDLVIRKLDKLAETILSRIKQPVCIDEHLFYVTCSIGVAVVPDNHADEDVLRFSDMAMYQAKTDGRNRIRFFNTEMQIAAEKQRLAEVQLQQAFSNDEFIVAFQPQVDLFKGAYVGAEALLRWQHPEKGIVYPAEFIPLLEESGRINEIGHWVIEQACHEMKLWQQQGAPEFRISVNVSASQFRTGTFIERLRDVILQTGIDPSRLELELTESVAIHDIDATVEKMKQLKSLGVRLALDDFGTGFSSLSYLKELPIDVLKLDRSFICGLPDDKHDVAIVEATMVMAKHLDLQVIAEGIERREQLNFIRRLQCDLVQGNFFSKPISAAELRDICKVQGCAELEPAE